jgi:hypothetical protein
MNDYISFLCTLLNIKIPKVYFKVNDKVYDLKHKPVNKELFQVKDTSICTSYPKENVICVNLNTSVDSSLVYIYLAHEIRHLYQYACVYKKNQKIFSMDERNVSIWKKELESYKDSRCKHYENQEIEKDANLFANFIAIVIFKRVLDIKEMDQKEYEFKTKLFMNFFASNPVKKKLIQKQISKMKV